MLSTSLMWAPLTILIWSVSLLTSSHKLITDWCHWYYQMLWSDLIASPDHSWLEPGPGHVNTDSGSAGPPGNQRQEFTLLRQIYSELDTVQMIIMSWNLDEIRCNGMFSSIYSYSIYRCLPFNIDVYNFDLLSCNYSKRAGCRTRSVRSSYCKSSREEFSIWKVSTAA